ncbi:MAG: hypothetical protein ASARMPREDX12_001105 [Alectoria sarmentosa]|nr:MAG: hypothetical protein ASARMPREDX12_001105 [Alectoria sarmentosa]
MSSQYTQGLEFLNRVQEKLNDIKPETRDPSVTVEKWNSLGQEWNFLRMAVITTGEAADKAVIASRQQSARHRVDESISIHSYALRTKQANACLSHFRYVTALSNHTRAMRQHHESELLSLGNLQNHYKEDLGPQAHIVQPHQTFLDTLGRNIEAVKRTQGLEMVCMRWNQSRAAADLTQQAKNFHLTGKRLDVRKKRADKASRRAYRLRKSVAKCVKEYDHLETEVLKVQRAIQALQNVLFGSASVSASTRDGNAEQMA